MKFFLCLESQQSVSCVFQANPFNAILVHRVLAVRTQVAGTTTASTT